MQQTAVRRLILLVEENVGRRERLYDLLRSHACSVVTSPSSEQALELLKHERPDLVLASCQDGHAGGRRLVEQIRSFDSLLPIILMGTPHTPSPSSSDERPAVQVVLPDNCSDEVIWSAVERSLRTQPQERREHWPGMILVVEDEEKLRHLLEEFLTLRGFTVQTVASGDEALQMCDRKVPTTVLLDIRMPGMDGLLTLKKLKAHHPALTVVMITAVQEEEAMEEALALGATDYIMKPFNFEYLETTLLSKLLVGPKR